MHCLGNLHSRGGLKGHEHMGEDPLGVGAGVDEEETEEKRVTSRNIYDSLPVCALILWGTSQLQNAILFPDELVVYQVQ